MLTQRYAADFDLDPVLLKDDPPENRSEQFPKLLRAHRRQTQGKLFRRGEESARNFGPFSGKVQPIEDLSVGFQKGEELLGDSVFQFLRRHPRRARCFVRRVLDGKLRDIIAISSTSSDCERWRVAVALLVFNQPRQ